MRAERRAELAQLVREQISAAIKADIEGAEALMKEVFEECCDEGELEVVYAEMRRLARLIRESRKGKQ